MIARRTAALLAATALAAALSACSPTTSPTSSPTPTAFASEEEAFAAAEATYRAYVDALNKVDLSDPATFEPLFALTTGDLNELDKKSFSQLHADGASVSGTTEIVAITPIDASDGEIRLAVCLNVSEVELEDAKGESLVRDDRPDFRSETATLQGTSERQLRIAKIADGLESKQCGD